MRSAIASSRHLPQHGPRPRHDRARQLLRQRARARDQLAFEQRLPERTQHGHGIDARVTIEARVFRGEQRGDDHGRQLSER